MAAGLYLLAQANKTKKVVAKKKAPGRLPRKYPKPHPYLRVATLRKKSVYHKPKPKIAAWKKPVYHKPKPKIAAWKKPIYHKPKPKIAAWKKKIIKRIARRKR